MDEHVDWAKAAGADEDPASKSPAISHHEDGKRKGMMNPDDELDGLDESDTPLMNCMSGDQLDREAQQPGQPGGGLGAGLQNGGDPTSNEEGGAAAVG